MIGFSKQVRVLILISALMFIAGVVFFSQYFSIREERLTQNIEQNIQDGREQLILYADITDRNQVDDVLRIVLEDCPQRSVFEGFLINLNDLSREDLLRTSQMFDACGDFFATRKGVMVIRLQREIVALRESVNLYIGVTKDNKYASLLAIWNDIASMEGARSDLLKEQVDIQQRIIEDLLTGKQSNIPEEIRRAQEIMDSLGVQDKQIETMRVKEQQRWEQTTAG